MPYAQLDTDGKIIGVYANMQPEYADVFVADDDESLVRFLGVPTVQPITRRQLRLTLVRNGIPLSAVDDAISAMPEGLEKEEARIEWTDASTFSRNHQTLQSIATGLGLSEDRVDALWAEAVTA